MDMVLKPQLLLKEKNLNPQASKCVHWRGEFIRPPAGGDASLNIASPAAVADISDRFCTHFFRPIT